MTDPHTSIGQRPASAPDGPSLDATDRRTGIAAGKVLGIGVLALALAIALNAQQLLREAQQKPFGWERDASVGIWQPVESASSAVGLHLPRLWAEEAMGRTVVDPGGVEAVASGAEAASAEADTPSDVGDSGGIVVADTSGDGEPAPSDSDSTAASTSESNPQSGSSAETGTESVAASQGGAEADPERVAADEPPPRAVPTPDQPLHLAVIGDSMVRFFGDTMVSLANETGVIEAQTEHQLSSGLTRPDFYDWPARIVEVMVNDDPDAVVLMFGGNDAQALAVNGQIAQPFSDAWAGEYSSRVAHMMDLVTTDPDRLLIWVGQPIMRDPDFDQKMVELNMIYATEAAERSRVRYVDTRDLFRGPDGGYSRYVIDGAGQRTDVRLTDGVHLSTIGGRWLSQLLLDELGEMVDLNSGASP